MQTTQQLDTETRGSLVFGKEADCTHVDHIVVRYRDQGISGIWEGSRRYPCRPHSSQIPRPGDLWYLGRKLTVPMQTTQQLDTETRGSLVFGKEADGTHVDHIVVRYRDQGISGIWEGSRLYPCRPHSSQIPRPGDLWYLGRKLTVPMQTTQQLDTETRRSLVFGKEADCTHVDHIVVRYRDLGISGIWEGSRRYPCRLHNSQIQRPGDLQYFGRKQTVPRPGDLWYLGRKQTVPVQTTWQLDTETRGSLVFGKEVDCTHVDHIAVRYRDQGISCIWEGSRLYRDQGISGIWEGSRLYPCRPHSSQIPRPGDLWCLGRKQTVPMQTTQQLDTETRGSLVFGKEADGTHVDHIVVRYRDQEISGIWEGSRRYPCRPHNSQIPRPGDLWYLGRKQTVPMQTTQQLDTETRRSLVFGKEADGTRVDHIVVRYRDQGISGIWEGSRRYPCRPHSSQIPRPGDLQYLGRKQTVPMQTTQQLDTETRGSLVFGKEADCTHVDHIVVRQRDQVISGIWEGSRLYPCRPHSSQIPRPGDLWYLGRKQTVPVQTTQQLDTETKRSLVFGKEADGTRVDHIVVRYRDQGIYGIWEGS